MTGLSRYFRLLGAFARFSLATELAYRANYLVKLFVEALWLGMMLVFYLKIFNNTDQIAGWSRDQYLFFVGCYFALGGLIETLFLENCTEFSELIRSGDLDFYLLRPIDEQFLITARKIDWSTAPNVILGAAIMSYSLSALGWQFDLLKVVLFVALFICGGAMAYSFLLMLSSTSVWIVRNQSLLEMWWLFTTLMRYPREIYTGKWASPFGWFFTFVVPILLVVNVPADTMIKTLDWRFVAWTLTVTAALLVLSRAFSAVRYSRTAVPAANRS
jgi:ABC-2 type transport system permease protein